MLLRRKAQLERSPPQKRASFSWQAILAGVAALSGSIYSVYKVYRFDENLSRIELQQKGIELLQARNAVVGFSFGRASISRVDGRASGSLSREPHASPQPAKFMLVKVPVTIKNLSRLPINIDFNEQWVFVGQLLGASKGPYAEVVNSSNDAYPVAWKRVHCTIAVSWSVLTNLRLQQTLLAEGKAAELGKLGVAYWAPETTSGNADDGRSLLRLAKPSTDEGRAQLGALKRIVNRRTYFDHSAVGATCGAVTDGLWTGPLRGGEERTATASYVVRSTDGWFGHTIRIHYRQVQDGSDAAICRSELLSDVQAALDRIGLGLEICTHEKRVTEDDYSYLDQRDALYLPAVLEEQERGDRKR